MKLLRDLRLKVYVPAVPMPAQKTFIFGSCFKSCGPIEMLIQATRSSDFSPSLLPVQRTCASGFFDKTYISQQRIDRHGDTHCLVGILVRIHDLASLFRHLLRSLDSTSRIRWFRLGWTTKKGTDEISHHDVSGIKPYLHAKSKEAHHPEFRFAGFITQKSTCITDIVKHTCDD